VRQQAASDEVLIARIAQGDRLAMQVLYGRHHVRVFRFGLRLVPDEQVAEDLISEVFLDVWRQGPQFEGPIRRFHLALGPLHDSSPVCAAPQEGR